MSSTVAHPTYKLFFVIWAWLIGLFVAGTFIPKLPLSALQGNLLILAISLVKTILVGMFFMHLKYDKSVPLYVIIFFPFVLIAVAVALVFVGSSFAA